MQMSFRVIPSNAASLSSFPYEDMRVQGSANTRRMPEIIAHLTWMIYLDEYVYLGTTFNYNNTFRKAQVKQLNQARRAMYSLLSKTYQLHLPIDLLIELFDQLVLPILLYGSEVWGFDIIKDLEILHMKFCKQILNVRKNTANCMVLGELGRLKLDKYIESRMINFWCNLVHSGQDKLSGKVYIIMKILFEENVYQSPWLKKIKITLDSIGMSNLWDSCETTSRDIWKFSFHNLSNI